MSSTAASNAIIEWFFQGKGAELLGAAAGVTDQKAVQALRAGLPLQLQAVSDYASKAPGNAQIAEAVSIIPNFPTVRAALEAGQGAADLHRAGNSMAPTILAERRAQIDEQVARDTGLNVTQTHELFNMTLPLILGRLGWRDDTALEFLPVLRKYGLAGAGGLLGTAASAAAFARPQATVPYQTAYVSPKNEERRRAFPLWLLPLLALLLLGGCWMLRPKGTTVSASGVTISDPARDAQVSAGGFNISGTGKAGETYQVFEDGTSIGTVKVGDDGKWTVDVAGPTAGTHQYVVKNAQGQEVASISLNVVHGAAGTCTAAPTISLGDNENVTAPFRFGGKGQASSYTVTVWRGDRQVGTKVVNLTPDCTWSYSSNPGGKSGQVDQIRYEVRPSDQTGGDPAVKATLNVSAP